MRCYVRTVCTICCLSLGSLFARPALADAKGEILRIIPTLDAAIKAHDVATLAGIFDPDGRFVGEDGKVMNQKQYLAVFGSDPMKIKSCKSAYESLRVFGDTVVEMGTFTQTGTTAGKPALFRVRYVSVWIKKNGRWVVTAEQSTVPRSAKPKK
jgi:uncharacterized protein (TIGR02246 family)